MCFECHPAHLSVEVGTDSRISTSAMLGVRLEKAGHRTVYAPRGLSDFFDVIVTPDTTLGTGAAYDKKVERQKGICPQLHIYILCTSTSYVLKNQAEGLYRSF